MVSKPVKSASTAFSSLGHIAHLFIPNGKKSARTAEQNVYQMYRFEQSRLDIVEIHLKRAGY